MNRFAARTLLMLLVLSRADLGHAAVYVYEGRMEILVTSGGSCAGLAGSHDVSLAVSEDGQGGGELNGYFVGSGITIGKFSGSDPARLAVRYPFQDEVRGSGHVMSLQRSSDSLSAELHDRHVEESADDCNFDLARLTLTRSSAGDVAVRLARMAGQFEAQLARSQALALVQSSGYEAAVPYFEKALQLADSYLAAGSEQLNSYIIGLATGYIWLERFDKFNLLFDTRIMAVEDEALRTVFSDYRVQTLMNAGRAALVREEYPTALAHFEQASRLQPRNREVVAAVMSVHVRSGRYTEAVTFLEHTESLMELEADRRDIRAAMAMVLFKKAQADDKNERAAEAESALKRAMVLDPAAVQYLIALARLRHKSGHLDEAESLLEEGLARFSDERSQQELMAARDRLRQTELFLGKIRRGGS